VRYILKSLNLLLAKTAYGSYTYTRSYFNIPSLPNQKIIPLQFSRKQPRSSSSPLKEPGVNFVSLFNPDRAEGMTITSHHAVNQLPSVHISGSGSRSPQSQARLNDYLSALQAPLQCVNSQLRWIPYAAGVRSS